jgi:hypothetical protein
LNYPPWRSGWRPARRGIASPDFGAALAPTFAYPVADQPDEGADGSRELIMMKDDGEPRELGDGWDGC